MVDDAVGVEQSKFEFVVAVAADVRVSALGVETDDDVSPSDDSDDSDDSDASIGGRFLLLLIVGFSSRFK